MTHMDKPIVSVLELWFEELQTFEALVAEKRERLWKLLEQTFHRCNHGDRSSCLFWSVASLEPQMRFEDMVSTRLKTLITGTIGWFILDCYTRYNLENDCACVDYLLTVFTKLSPKLRKWCLQHMYKEYLDALAKLLGSEVVDALSKSRVEVKLVLDVEEVLPLVRRFGKEWREKVKEAFREALKMVVSK
jgi:uncharacterized protein (DUF4415 family)